MNALCWATIVIFSDSVWRPSAERLARQLAPACVEHVDMPLNGTEQWGSREYFRRIGARLPHMTDLMARRSDGAGWLALFDADMVALRNVTARIERLFALHPHIEFVVQQELPCQTLPLRPCINGGLWAARRSATALAALRRATWLADHLRIPDQDALAIATADLAVHFLDSERYANGHTVLRNCTWRAGNAHLIHMNWPCTAQWKLAWLDHFWRHRFHSDASKYDGAAGAMRRCSGV